MLTGSASVLNQPLVSPYATTSDAEAGRRLTSAFDHATEEVSEQTMALLNDAAVDFVDRLRDEGMTPERVIVAVKTALRSGHRMEWSWFPSLDVTSDWASARNESAVYARLFSWCVEAYYNEREISPRRRSDIRRERPAPLAACRASL
jgi:hypothetical protein